MYKLVLKRFSLERTKTCRRQSSGVLEELFILFNSSKKQTAHKLGFDQCLEEIIM